MANVERVKWITEVDPDGTGMGTSNYATGGQAERLRSRIGKLAAQASGATREEAKLTPDEERIDGEFLDIDKNLKNK